MPRQEGWRIGSHSVGSPDKPKGVDVVGKAILGSTVAIVTIFSAAMYGRVLSGASYNNAVELEKRLIEEKGLADKHPIVDLSTVPEFSANGEISGGFLSFIGRFEGKPTRMLQFAWKVNEGDNRIFISEMPIDNVTFFITDDPSAKSTILFGEIDPKKFVQADRRPYGHSSAIDDPNLSNYIPKEDSLTVISLSRKTYDEFRNAGKTSS